MIVRCVAEPSVTGGSGLINFGGSGSDSGWVSSVHFCQSNDCTMCCGAVRYWRLRTYQFRRLRLRHWLRLRVGIKCWKVNKLHNTFLTLNNLLSYVWLWNFFKKLTLWPQFFLEQELELETEQEPEPPKLRSPEPSKTDGSATLLIISANIFFIFCTQ